MKNFTTDAINIKTYPLSEHDNIVVMFSKQKGLMRGVAKGVKRPKSKLGARMQMLVANKLMLYEGKNLDTICQAQALNTFNGLRQDLDKLTYSIYLAEIIGIFCQEGDTEEADYNKKIYELFYGSLACISNSADIVQILLNVVKFQLKFMQILGYALELEKCPVKIRSFFEAILETDVDEPTKYDALVNEKVIWWCFGVLRNHINRQSPKTVKTLGVLEGIK